MASHSIVSEPQPPEKKPKLNDYGGEKEERCDDSSSVTPDDRDAEIEQYDDEKIVYYKDGFHKRTRKETDMYNERIRATGEADYEFVKVCKATAKGVAGIIYYVTFEAKDGGSGQSQIFQAKVWRAIRDIKVISCGPKHASSV